MKKSHMEHYIQEAKKIQEKIDQKPSRSLLIRKLKISYEFAGKILTHF